MIANKAHDNYYVNILTWGEMNALFRWGEHDLNSKRDIADHI